MATTTDASSSRNEDEDNDEVELWAREETPVLEIPIHNTKDEQVMRLRQYGSHDDRWGIHSCVWDGGIGTLAYFFSRTTTTRNESAQASSSPVIVDIGAGTGIVGLGMALFHGYNAVLTDLPEALGLLQVNIRLNADAIFYSSQNMKSTNVLAMSLPWGEPVLPEQLQKVLESASHVIVVGADIVYRQNLFEPLLWTLRLLLQCRPDAECIIGTQSIRSHLDEFWLKAKKAGYSVEHECNILVPEGTMDPNVCQQVPTAKGPGIVNIFELSLAATATQY